MRRPGGILDLVVAVDERQAQPLGEAAADGRLARPHQADEDDWTVKAVGQILHRSGLYIRAWGRAKAFPMKPLYAPPRKMRRSPLVPLLAVAVLLIAAALWFLSSRATEQPVTTIEAEVSANAATR